MNRTTRRLVEELPRFIQKGGARAISAEKLLELIGLPDTEANCEQLLMATEVWLERGVFIGIKEHGYFLVETEEERQQCLSYMKRELALLGREIDQMKSLPLGGSWPAVEDSST